MNARASCSLRAQVNLTDGFTPLNRLAATRRFVVQFVDNAFVLETQFLPRKRDLSDQLADAPRKSSQPLRLLTKFGLRSGQSETRRGSSLQPSITSRKIAPWEASIS